MSENNIVNELREVCLHFCPELKIVLAHESVITNSTWKNIESGKALEITALCVTIFSFQKIGYTLSIPAIYKSNPDLFYLRNIIPRHHDAQAGHDAAFSNLVPLEDRFVASLTPKAVLKNSEEVVFSIFREGHIVHRLSHLLKNNNEYLDRPDIVIAQGEMSLFKTTETEIDFVYNQPIGNISGKLRIKNDNKIPLMSYSPSSGGDILINGIVECSVGKGSSHAGKQVKRYKTLFASIIVPSTALLNGYKYIGKHVEHEIFIDLVDWSREKVINTLENGFQAFVEVVAQTSKII